LVNLKNAKPTRIAAERATAAQSTDFVEREKHTAIQVILCDYHLKRTSSRFEQVATKVCKTTLGY
jgi:hypothetical protein